MRCSKSRDRAYGRAERPRGNKKVNGFCLGSSPALSNDAEFFPGLSKSWALTFMINDEPAPTGRPAGALGLGWSPQPFLLDRSPEWHQQLLGHRSSPSPIQPRSAATWTLKPRSISRCGCRPDRSYSRCSSPNSGDSGQRTDAAHGQQHPGHERHAVDRVVPDRQRLADVAEDHLLMGDQTRQAHRVDRDLDVLTVTLRHCRLHQRGGPRGGSRLAASSLRSWCSSMISAARMCLAALDRELHHQHRADREVRGDEHVRRRRRADRRVASGVEAGRPDHDVDAGGDGLVGVGDHGRAGS